LGGKFHLKFFDHSNFASVKNLGPITLSQAMEGFYSVKKGKRSLDKDRRSAARLLKFFGKNTLLRRERHDAH
jgi:hypothetical protein